MVILTGKIDFQNQVSQIVTRYLNETIQRYNYLWITCPNQGPETDVERSIVDLTTNFEKNHFPELIRMGNWFTMEFNLDYSKIQKMLMQEILEKTAEPLTVLQFLLSWGGLQAVRGVAHNKPLLAMEVQDFLKLTINEELFSWWENEGGWVMI
jgi:hypothetical protein